MAFGLLKRFYGFEHSEIVKLTLYQFRKYMDNIELIIKLEQGEKPEHSIPITGKLASHVMKRIGKRRQ